ncbi:MAG: hypothetical protein K2W82_10670 [Candidatus Obscuribacterales bacterium]|nr:hypothetical protein [Candidatus Obscuribacterales bacterium]
MNAHYTRIAVFSLGILVISGTLFYLVSVPSSRGKNDAIPAQKSENKAVVRHLPGDERDGTGVLDREVHYDADGQKVKLVVHFVDRTMCLVEYDLLERLKKVVETDPQGNYQVFNLSQRQGQVELLEIQAYRADKTLRRTVKPDEKSSVISHYAEDGKRLVCVQTKYEDESYEVKIFHEDGVTPKCVFKQAADLTEASMEIYSEKGLLSRQESVGLNEDDEIGSPTTFREVMKIVGYRDDGKTVWYSGDIAVNGASSEKSEPQPFVTEFWPDGKTAKRIVFDLSDEPGFDYSAQNPERFRVQLCNKKGNPVKERILRIDYTVVREKTIADNEEKVFYEGEEYDSESEAIIEAGFGQEVEYLDEYLTPEVLEPNHLDRALAPFE